MQFAKVFVVAITGYLAIAVRLPAQQLKPQTIHDFECYTASAEARMAARPAFLAIDSDAAFKARVMAGDKAETVLGNGANPHKVSGAMLYDWIGVIFIPHATLDRTVRMLQDYDHRPLYFPEIISTSKLLCRTGEDRFGFSMRLKEPAVIDSTNDVVWERVDAHREKCRSYSTEVHEVGANHNYLLRLNSYWRFVETDQGVLVEGQTITLSGEFSGLMRTLGSLAGINPEKSLKKSLGSMRESLLKPGVQFPAPQTGLPACGEPVRMTACDKQAGR
jgi:hypothetical protein